MADKVIPHCGRCENKACYQGQDCFVRADRHRELYRDESAIELHKAAAAIEARHYRKETRLGEVILFAKELKVKRIGLAFCIGLSAEAKVVEEILAQHFEVASVCCKICGLEKREFGLERIPENNNEHEVMCNPAGQADILNEAGTELNVLCGLCVGHDAIFSKVSAAPVTTLIAKDRVLAHNPAGAIYSQYVRRRYKTNDGLTK